MITLVVMNIGIPARVLVLRLLLHVVAPRANQPA